VEGGTTATGIRYSDDTVLIPALRDGDEGAFVWLLDRYDQSLRRLAMNYVQTCTVADEVVQDTWMGVMNGPCSSRTSKAARYDDRRPTIRPRLDPRPGECCVALEPNRSDA
jgi:hypothetical protein